MGALTDRVQKPGVPAVRPSVQIPGPTNIDQRSAEFATLTQEAEAGIKKVVRTEEKIVIYPLSGTGAWKAARENVRVGFSPSGIRDISTPSC